MEDTCINKVGFPKPIPGINDWAFKFRYDFTKQLEGFLSSGLIIDYICIKFIYNGELALISTKPALELNLINTNLFLHDKSFSYEAFNDGRPRLWVDHFARAYFNELQAKKIDNFGLTSGISLFTQHDNQMLSASFATNKNYGNINEYYLANTNYLSSIAVFAEKVAWPMFCQIFKNKLHRHQFRQNNNIFIAIDNSKGL